MKAKPETLSFLRNEARKLFKSLPYSERKRLGSYRPLFAEFKQAWKKPENRISVEDVKALETK